MPIFDYQIITDERLSHTVVHFLSSPYVALGVSGHLCMSGCLFFLPSLQFVEDASFQTTLPYLLASSSILKKQ